jgi:glycine cleavage system transcriptional repressor
VGANVETSRMSRLGGEFAMLLLASVPQERAGDVEGALATLAAQGYRIASTVTREPIDEARAAWRSYRVEVRGADHEGIIHEVARGLANRGISIEAAETGTTEAPITGTPLFTMTALVAVPPDVVEQEWMGSLEEAASVSNVDVTITPE